MPEGATNHRRQQRLLLTAGLLVADVSAIALALTAAHRLANARSIWYAPEQFPPALWLVIPIAIAIFGLGRLYVLDELLEGSVEYGRVVYGCTLAALSLVLLGFWGKFLQDVAPSRTLIVLVWGVSVFAVGGGRFLIRRAVRFLRRRGYLISRAVIVGLGTSGLAFARHFQQARHSGVRVVGFVDDFLPPGTPVLGDLVVLGPPSDLDRILEETGAHEVIIVPTATAWESFQELMRRAATMNGCRVRLAPGSRDLLATTLRAHQLAQIPMLTVERVRITGLDRVLKSTLDYAIALALLAPAALGVLLSAAALRAWGLRPFRRMRIIGREGRPVSVYILNTGDARRGVPRLIRRLRVDRLPLLAAVLLGRMSLVGPRPIPLERRAAYAAWLPSLLTVRPGVTGLWAVRPTASLDDEMEQSLFYIRHYTIWLDIEVLLRAVLRLISGNGRQEEWEGTALRERVPVHR
ncbi:MAG: sugar transferase [Armatimonadota bacterium]|nr:sugar transferase [Armatimonadota bacterium]MDR7452267.1 sugar transferase [Armatimonadota bacterium]MDR7467969.1 sugar transferase [Armatimonadota bacterium]MDR7494811.1 sugar transferase [Armatimonadota bacterium]MDR7499235.1 sugar transferase [Armatimonadota bacterium]